MPEDNPFCHGGRISESEEGFSPPPNSVTRFFLLVFVILVFFGGIAQALHFELGMLFTQWVVILLPALWFWRRHGFLSRNLHRLSPLPAKYIPTLLLLGTSAWFFNMLVALALVRFLMKFGYQPTVLLPPPDTWAKLAVYFLVIVFSAGVCEEILFRGTIMPALESQGAVPAVLFSSMLFALMHVSFLNLPGTFFLGLLFGVAVLKTGSLLAGVFFHMLNNAVSVTFLFLSTCWDLEGLQESIVGFPYFALFVISLAGLAAGLLVLQRQTGVKPLLEDRQAWLPRGWFNWAFLTALILFIILASLELIIGFNII